MRYLQIVFTLAIVGCTCSPRSGQTTPAAPGVHAGDDFKQFVENVLFFRRTSREVQTEFDVRHNAWSLEEKRRAVGIALEYLKPWYSDSVYGETQRMVFLEGIDGYPQYRKWLREYGKSGDNDTVHILAILAETALDREIPEWFDIFSFWVNSWVDRGPGSASVRLYMPRGIFKTGREWWTWDAAAEEFRYAFGKYMPGVTHMELGRYWESTDEEKWVLLTEWREHMPKWLREHPEARSWWIQRFYHGYVERRDGMLEDGRFTDVLPRINATIANLEKEFPEELADRRGICAEPAQRTPPERKSDTKQPNRAKTERPIHGALRIGLTDLEEKPSSVTSPFRVSNLSQFVPDLAARCGSHR